MQDLRLNNSIFLMFLATESYKKNHGLSADDFHEIDQKYHILKYIAECPDVFDNMTADEMAKEIDYYVAA